MLCVTEIPCFSVPVAVYAYLAVLMHKKLQVSSWYIIDF